MVKLYRYKVISNYVFKDIKNFKTNNTEEIFLIRDTTVPNVLTKINFYSMYINLFYPETYLCVLDNNYTFWSHIEPSNMKQFNNLKIMSMNQSIDRSFTHKLEPFGLILGSIGKELKLIKQLPKYCFNISSIDNDNVKLEFLK